MDERRLFGLVLGAVIARLRARNAWTQERLADRVGISQATLSRMESGILQPDARQLGLFAAAFGMTAGSLHVHVEDGVARTKRAADAVMPGALARVDAAGVSGLVAFVVAAG